MTAESIPCPSEFWLERLRHGEVERTPAQAGHLESCDSCRARLGDWSIAAGRTTRTRHRLLVYTGPHDKKLVDSVWADFSAGK